MHWRMKSLGRSAGKVVQGKCNANMMLHNLRNILRTEMQDSLKVYKRAGRWIVRIYGPWLDLNQAFRLGLAEDSIFDIETIDDDQ